jgi:hypothetical protein
MSTQHMAYPERKVCNVVFGCNELEHATMQSALVIAFLIVLDTECVRQ